jgi:hypothetical protein
MSCMSGPPILGCIEIRLEYEDHTVVRTDSVMLRMPVGVAPLSAEAIVDKLAAAAGVLIAKSVEGIDSVMPSPAAPERLTT